MILEAIVPQPIKPNVTPPVVVPLSSLSLAVVRIILGVVAAVAAAVVVLDVAAAVAVTVAVGIVLLILLVIPKACVDVVIVVKSNTPTIVEYNRYR